MENRFYKVTHEGGTLVTGMFFNPVTKEEDYRVLRDYEYEDCSRDNDEWYKMPIDEEAFREWKHHHGEILQGDKAKVIKGRTIEHGFIDTVKNIHKLKDKYGRYIATYIYFNDGRKINIKNCELVKGEVLSENSEQ